MKKTIYTKKHGQLITALRQARGDAALTQAELAKRLGKPQSFVAKYEKGERRLDVVEFLAIAEAIGFDPKKMIGEMERS